MSDISVIPAVYESLATDNTLIFVRSVPLSTKFSARSNIAREEKFGIRKIAEIICSSVGKKFATSKSRVISFLFGSLSSDELRRVVVINVVSFLKKFACVSPYKSLTLVIAIKSVGIKPLGGFVSSRF